MADDYAAQSGDTGGGTAVLEDSPSSAGPESSSQADAGPISGADSGDEVGSSEPSIPKSRYDQAIANERAKHERLKWAEAYDAQQVQQRWQLADWIDRDPVGFANEFNRQLQAYGYRQQQPAAQGGHDPNAFPGPDYQYRDEQGNLAKFYSADRMQQVVQYLENRFGQRLAPVEQFLGSQQVQMRAQSDAQRILGEAASWPHFEEFRSDIHDAMAQNRNLTLERAYIQVVTPQLGNRERAALVNDLQQKPQATTTSPSSAHPHGTQDLSKLSLQQLFKREMKRRGMGT